LIAAGRDPTAAMVVAAIDQQTAHAHLAHIAERDFPVQLPSFLFESVAKANRFEFDPDGVLDWNDRACLEYESRKHRAELVNGRRIVAVKQHISTPVTHSYHERLNLEIVGRLPLCEDFQYALLRIFVLNR
jgi:hypothetical protein